MKVIKTLGFRLGFLFTLALASYMFLLPKQYRLSCPIHESTGIYCPGCGSTRAIDAVFHGDMVSAWRFNPLLVLSPLLLATAWAIQRFSKSRTWAFIYFAGLMVIITIFTLLRNLPNSPLAPI